MPPKPKTETERLQLRCLIIDAARELFVSRGEDAVTMREIARRIDYSPTAIYLHFKDKESLIRELCDTDFLVLASNLNPILAIADPVARMLALGQAYAQFALSHPNHYRMMFMTQRPARDPEHSAVTQHNPNQDAYALLNQVVNEVYQSGAFLPHLNDAELIAQTIWASIHGVCSLEITLAHDTWMKWRDISARLNLMEQTMVRGLLRQNL